MHSPDDRSWPVTADGVMDWEAVFENPDTGFLPMIALARSPEALKQTTLVIIRTLFSRKNDESNFETYTAQLDEIVPDDAPASEFDAMRAGVIELLRRIKQERQRVAAEYHASEKAAKDDERPIPEDEKETGDEDPALRADPRTCDSSTRGWRCQTPEHDADHGETDEGDNGSGITLEVAGEAPVAADPGERSLHDPAFRQGHEAVRVGALNDFQLPAAGRGDGRRHPRPLVAAVGEDGLDEGERTARGSKQLAGAVAILHVGGMDDDAQQQAECIDEDVALAPRDLLARIEALRVERSPPFCAPLALWLSITAADGLASRPSRSRTAT